MAVKGLQDFLGQHVYSYKKKSKKRYMALDVNEFPSL